MNPEDAIRAVFGTVGRHVDPGEVEDVVRMLPRDIRPLWPDRPEAA